MFFLTTAKSSQVANGKFTDYAADSPGRTIIEANFEGGLNERIFSEVP
jgi:hypothetical protein